MHAAEVLSAFTDPKFAKHQITQTQKEILHPHLVQVLPSSQVSWCPRHRARNIYEHPCFAWHALECPT